MARRLVTYTTKYRSGGALLERAARTLARERQAHCVATEDKAAFVRAVTEAPLAELHFVGHSGMYGPMFGTTSLPEQLSPHEWRSLPLAFAPGGAAFFHACRTGRWFAPFFARTFGVEAWGHQLYTTFSREPERYRPVRGPGDVFVVGQPGRKSHGLLGSVGKHLGLLPPEPMTGHLPEPAEDTGYEQGALAYDRVFDDIRVRDPEWRWLEARVPAGATLLDLGCGTGALLRALRPRLADGIGVDVSPEMLAVARRREPSATFHQLDGPRLPLPDDSVQLVVSLLSWRYVDWDPLLAEVMRVLAPGGRLLVVDMVASPAGVCEWPRLVRDKARAVRSERAHPGFREARARLVADPAWQRMLTYNPIRAEHEYRWYFESRFPGRALEVLDVGQRTRIVAFDTGPVHTGWLPPQSYP